LNGSIAAAVEPFGYLAGSPMKRFKQIRVSWAVAGALFTLPLLGRAQTAHTHHSAAPYPFLAVAQDASYFEGGAPLLLFLHGRSLSGTDLSKVRKYGPIDAMERGLDVEALVVAPQLKPGERWEPEKVIQVVEAAQRLYGTDSCRVYVAGMSLGGYGTMDFVGTYPDRVEAAVAICGGGTEGLACGLAETRLWIQHGTLDRHVPHAESVKMHEAVKACREDAPCMLTLHPDCDHGKIAREFYRGGLYAWLFRGEVP
jgi:dienelactone hydrolase